MLLSPSPVSLKSNCKHFPIFVAELPVFHTGLIPKDVHCRSVQGISWYHSMVYTSNLSKSQPDPGQERQCDPSSLRASKTPGSVTGRQVGAGKNWTQSPGGCCNNNLKVTP